MGTRADFYVGRGVDAEWLGSYAWDGHPDSLSHSIVTATAEQAFRDAVFDELVGRDDGTIPEQGWPWPWNDSHTTDYTYAFDDGKVWGSNFGGDWFDPQDEPLDDTSEHTATFPDMSARQNVNFGKRSGAIFIGSAGVIEDES